MKSTKDIFYYLDPPESLIFNNLLGILSELPYNSEGFTDTIKRSLISDTKTGVSINFYPGGRPGHCKSECVAVATEKFAEEKTENGLGFKGLMNEICRHWWSCLNKTKVTFIVVRNWDQDAFESNYLHIIQNYESNTQGRVFIVESSPRQLIPRYPLP